MANANVHDPDFDANDDRSGVVRHRAAVGRQAGAVGLGATVHELPPGGTAYPYHFHYGNEELIVVLTGRPSLRTPEGERELAEGSVVAFRPGPAGGHQLINRSGEPVRYVMFSTRRSPEFIEYPDSGKVGVGSMPLEGDEGPDPVRFLFKADSAVGYFDGEEAPS